MDGRSISNVQRDRPKPDSPSGVDAAQLRYLFIAGIALAALSGVMMFVAQ